VTMGGIGPVIDAGLDVDVAAFGLAAAFRAGVLRAAGAGFLAAFLIWRVAIEKSSGLRFHSTDSMLTESLQERSAACAKPRRFTRQRAGRRPSRRRRIAEVLAESRLKGEGGASPAVAYRSGFAGRCCRIRSPAKLLRRRAALGSVTP